MAYTLLIVIILHYSFYLDSNEFFLFPSKISNQEGKLKYFTSFELSGLQNLYRAHKRCIKYQLHNLIG